MPTALIYKQKIINAVYYLLIRISCTSTPKFCKIALFASFSVLSIRTNGFGQTMCLATLTPSEYATTNFGQSLVRSQAVKMSLSIINNYSLWLIPRYLRQLKNQYTHYRYCCRTYVPGASPILQPRIMTAILYQSALNGRNAYHTNDRSEGI